MLQPILTDSSDFAEIRTNQCIYVDKTAYFHHLISCLEARRFFLVRPRRFGKSLMISTLKSIFEGRRDLFDGLAVSQTDWAWEKYPVLQFNFINAAASNVELFSQLFAIEVERGIMEAGGTYNPQWSPVGNFARAMDALPAANGGKGVVVLIDEYDAPVARLLDKPDEAETVRALLLADFYSQMKDRTGKIRFLMITGVSKFTKMSVFSALSNLVDLSMEDDYATMLGYTEKELDEYFDGHLHAHAEKMGLSYSDYRAEMKRWFNGYRFGQTSAETVYNPVSIGVNLFKRKAFLVPSWSETGKSSMLMNFLRRDDFLSVNMDGVQNVLEQDFDVSDIRALRAMPMLYQAGYLTIGDYNRDTGMFTLRVPDEEVRRDLATLTMAVAAPAGHILGLAARGKASHRAVG